MGRGVGGRPYSLRPHHFLQAGLLTEYKDDVNGFPSWIRYSARYVFDLDVDEFIVKCIFII